ncbi:hypothetical protein WDL1P1_00929 (plasmid) [Variovorax sp. WDL1]|nr:hypothetical protein CHC06_05584 [Variovorax sp. B2]PNG50875.1 hypothetical protein CHC07_05489 [Variovorax sp. B4]VTU41597.1 hypothetical protein H6P1_00004 [Variovorax sp. PBL-H6]VTU44703.1 hypothetical protein SRS16P1_00899 [Variovorax sp. SRS16]VTU44742.1 hypothetical protein E5P1_00891 [Variovorax sp. PBL-E5]VTV18115.1 hypothetical protein WDL1P1_00929 [Variovorax sp. WDL1]
MLNFVDKIAAEVVPSQAPAAFLKKEAPSQKGGASVAAGPRLGTWQKKNDG